VRLRARRQFERGSQAKGSKLEMKVHTNANKGVVLDGEFEINIQESVNKDTVMLVPHPNQKPLPLADFPNPRF